MKIIKQSLSLIGMLGVALGYVLTHPIQFGFCAHTYTFGETLECLDEVLPMWGGVIILFSIPLFLLSLITYKLPERTFRSWFYGLVVWWIPLSMVLIYITPATGHTTLFPDPLTKGPVAFALSALFVIISLIIILVSYLRARKKEKQVVGK